MIHRYDRYRRPNVCNRVGGTIFDDREVITTGSLIEDEEIVALQKFDVFAHQPRMIAPFDRDSTQESKQGLGEPGTEEILPSGEIYEGKRWVKDILREIGGYTNEKRIIHGRMVRNEKHPFPSPRDIAPSPHAGKIEGKSKK